VDPGGGGTPQLAGSHRVFASYISETGETDYKRAKFGFLRSHPWLRELSNHNGEPDRDERMARGADIGGTHVSVVECTGRAGAPVDDFVIPKTRELKEACRMLDRPWEDGPYGEAARELLAQHEVALAAAFGRYDELARCVRTDDFVVTHGEPHRGNTIVTATGTVLIDWDPAEVAEFVTQFRRPHTENADTNIAWLALQRFLDPQRW
jgi:hypothetical protein